MPDALARGPRVHLRPLDPADQAEFLRLVRRSRTLHRPWSHPPATPDGFRELAALYLQQASTAQERAQIYQVRSDYLAPGSIRDTIFQLGGSPLSPDPITNAVSTSYDQQISAAASEIQTASAQAVEQYRKIAALQPKDPTVQLELAQAAQSANDTATVIAAYEAFLRLAPDDPTAPEVRRILKQYKQLSPSG